MSTSIKKFHQVHKRRVRLEHKNTKKCNAMIAQCESFDTMIRLPSESQRTQKKLYTHFLKFIQLFSTDLPNHRIETPLNSNSHLY